MVSRALALVLLVLPGGCASAPPAEKPAVPPLPARFFREPEIARAPAESEERLRLALERRVKKAERETSGEGR